MGDCGKIQMLRSFLKEPDVLEDMGSMVNCLFFSSDMQHVSWHMK
jgi:hypothetical protein